MIYNFIFILLSFYFQKVLQIENKILPLYSVKGETLTHVH